MIPKIFSRRPPEILLVEDNPGDVELTREGLLVANVSNNLHVVSDGVEAIEFLRRIGKYVEVPRPDIILLDLNLPKKDGRAVLTDIKADEDLRLIPVVVLTTSQAEEDVLRSYQLNANCYIAKPVSFSGFAEVVRAIQVFWFGVVVLPSNRAKE